MTRIVGGLCFVDRRLDRERLSDRSRRGQSITTIASFATDSPTGGSPSSGVVFDSQGDLYGTTAAGGSVNGIGTVYKIAAGSNTITPLQTFYGSQLLSGPYNNGVVLDGQGNLYSAVTTGVRNGVGMVYTIAAGTSTLTPIASFDNSPTAGSSPAGGVVFDAHGDIFGTTTYGGTFGTINGGYGTVYEIAAGSHTITTLASFNGTTGGGLPNSGVVVDAQGNIFGTTSTGGAYGTGARTSGTVFEIAAGSHTITTLASFNGPTTGGNPYGPVVLDSQGNLFGTTFNGGAYGYGTAYEIAAGSHTITTLASFLPGTGEFPVGVVLDSQGDLFGATYLGGAYGHGTLYEIVAGSDTITVLASFNGTTNGGNPYSGVLLGNNGDIFGTTRFDGAYGNGTVWEFTPAGAVPEPTSLVLFAVGIAGVGLYLARRRGKTARA